METDGLLLMGDRILTGLPYSLGKPIEWKLLIPNNRGDIPSDFPTR